MKHRLPTLLCAALLLAGSLTLLPSCEDAVLKAYPTEQVDAMKERLALLQDMNDILAAPGSDEQKTAALEALRPRAEASAARIRGMSSYRYRDIQNALGLEKEKKMTALISTLNDATQRAAEGQHARSLAARVAWELYELPSASPFAPDAPAAEVAAAILRQVEELEALLQTEGLSLTEEQEALRLHHEKHLFFYVQMHAPNSGGPAYLRAVEEQLRATPGAAECLQRHLQHIEESVQKQRKAGEPATDLEETLAEARQYYFHTLRRLVVDDLAELTEAGRQELARLTAFLQEQPQTRFYVGYSHGDEDEGLIHLDYSPEDKMQQAPTRHTLSCTPAGDAAARQALIEAVDEHYLTLLRVEPRALTCLSASHARLEGLAQPADFYHLLGGWQSLQRVLVTHPELRARIIRQEGLTPNPDAQP